VDDCGFGLENKELFIVRILLFFPLSVLREACANDHWIRNRRRSLLNAHVSKERVFG
jgi:hypothetical protein